MKLPGIGRQVRGCLACLALALPLGTTILPVNSAMGAPPVAKPQNGPLSGAALRTAVRTVLTASRGQQQPDAAQVRRLAGLYHTLQVDTSLARSQRESLRLAVLARLKTWETRLQSSTALQVSGSLPAGSLPARHSASDGRSLPAKDLARRADGRAQSGLARQPVLAQQAAPGGPQQPAATQPPVDHSRELLEVIQDTIAPDSWDVRGGPGAVRYWAPGHALIIRQTGEVHEPLGRLLGDLRQ